MVAPIYTNRKGIYKDLYREIDSDNKKMKASQARKPRKGIYVSIYKQIEKDRQSISFRKDEDERNILLIQAAKIVKKGISNVLSKITYFFSAIAGEFKILAIAFVFAKKPINDYIDQNIPVYDSEGTYYND